MRDEFAGQRLPDLPNEGYATRREKAASDAIMFFVRNMERNRMLLLTVVCSGREQWHKEGAEWRRALRLSTDSMNQLFNYFLLLGSKPTLKTSD